MSTPDQETRIRQLTNRTLTIITALSSAISLAFPAPGQAENLRIIESVAGLAPHHRSLVEATGLLKVYPFQNKRNHFIQCTATHVGEGLVLTSGHCFLGSLACNGARVSFGLPNEQPREARCLRVLQNQAAGSAYGLPRRDYALFQIDEIPAEFVSLSQHEAPDLNPKLFMLGFPRLKKPRNTNLMMLAEGCSLTDLTGKDLFNRNRGRATVLHNCSAIAGMHGALLYNTISVRPVALHQAGSLEPIQNDLSTFGISRMNNIAQAIRQLDPVHRFLSSPHTRAWNAPAEFDEAGSHILGTADETTRVNQKIHIRIGSHLPEAFPLGTQLPLELDVGTFDSSSGEDVLQLAIRTGSKTQVTVRDGHGAETVFASHSYYELTKEKRFATPVQISVQSLRGAQAYFADIQILP